MEPTDPQANAKAFNAELDELCKKYKVTLAPDFNPQFGATLQLLLDAAKNYPPIIRIIQNG